MTGKAFERVRDALERHGEQPRKVGREYQARCPVHNGDGRTLHFRDGNGCVLLTCRAHGCAKPDIAEALGLTVADLFDEPRGKTYEYRNANGSTHRRVHRSPDKRFRQSDLDGTPPILYRLPEVLHAVSAGQVVYLVEGEQDADTLTQEGVCATTAPMGATNFHKCDVSALKHAQVVAVVDRDKAGDTWAATVRRRLAEVGATVRFVHAKEGKDATDHVLAGHGVDDFEPYVWSDDPPPAEAPEDTWGAKVNAEALKLQLHAEAAELFAAQRHARTWKPPADYGNLTAELALPDDGAQWRIGGMLGVGHNAIVVAGRKTGKTTLVGNLIRSYVDGKPFLGRFEVEQADAGIAVFNYEVDDRQFRRWLRDVGIGNTDRVFVLHLRGRTLPLKDPRVRAWTINWLRQRHIGMWVVDPYSRAYVGSLDDGNNEAQVGAFLDALDVIKAEAGVGELVMPVHTPKAKVDAGEETAIGSQRLEGWPDSMWYLTRDLESGARFLRAEGRDVDLPEEQLTYHADTRELALNGGGNRAQAKRGADAHKLIEHVRNNPGCTGRDICSALGWGNDRLGKARTAADKAIRTTPGKNGSRNHYIS